ARRRSASADVGQLGRGDDELALGVVEHAVEDEVLGHEAHVLHELAVRGVLVGLGDVVVDRAAGAVVVVLHRAVVAVDDHGRAHVRPDAAVTDELEDREGHLAGRDVADAVDGAVLHHVLAVGRERDGCRVPLPGAAVGLELDPVDAGLLVHGGERDARARDEVAVAGAAAADGRGDDGAVGVAGLLAARDDERDGPDGGDVARDVGRAVGQGVRAGGAHGDLLGVRGPLAAVELVLDGRDAGVVAGRVEAHEYGAEVLPGLVLLAAHDAVGDLGRDGVAPVALDDGERDARGLGHVAGLVGRAVGERVLAGLVDDDGPGVLGPARAVEVVLDGRDARAVVGRGEDDGRGAHVRTVAVLRAAHLVRDGRRGGVLAGVGD